MPAHFAADDFRSDSGHGPAAAGYNVTARTSFGRIHSDGDITVTGDLSPDSLTGKIGSGGCDLRLMDQNGNIDILRN